jgi:hypothetical protein
MSPEAKAQALLCDSLRLEDAERFLASLPQPLGQRPTRYIPMSNGYKTRTPVLIKHLVDLVNLEKAGSFFWPIPGLAPPELDQRPAPKDLYINMAPKGWSVAPSPLDRYFDLSRLQHLTVGREVDDWIDRDNCVDLSWLAVIPTTLRTIRIDGAETRTLEFLYGELETRQQTQLETLELDFGNDCSLSTFNPLESLPTLRRLDLATAYGFEQLVRTGHECLETLRINSLAGQYYYSETMGEFPARHPARRFVDALCAARAGNPSLWPAFRTLILPDHELYPDPKLCRKRSGLDRMVRMLREQDVAIVDQHGNRQS